MKNLLRGYEGDFRSFRAESLQNRHIFLLFTYTVSFDGFDVLCYTGSGFLFVLLNLEKGKK